MPDTIDYSKSITIPSNIVREIWYWLEGRRNPDDPIKPVTITISETGIGQTIKVFHEIKKGEGVYKDFSEYEKW